MVNHYGKVKTEAYNLNRIEISWLKKNNYLDGFREGTITWPGKDRDKSKVRIQVYSDYEGKGYIRLIHKVIGSDDFATTFEYNHEITSTKCHFGGHRSWFLCNFCGKRVGALFRGSPCFYCRHCLNLTYSSRNENRRSEYYPLIRNKKLRAKEKNIRVKYYKGRPTKRYQSLLDKGGLMSDLEIERMLAHYAKKYRLI